MLDPILVEARSVDEAKYHVVPLGAGDTAASLALAYKVALEASRATGVVLEAAKAKLFAAFVQKGWKEFPVSPGVAFKVTTPDVVYVDTEELPHLGEPMHIALTRSARVIDLEKVARALVEKDSRVTHLTSGQREQLIVVECKMQVSGGGDKESPLEELDELG
ncbi:MAG: hypothetical protein HY220_02210 [Candidatus Sungbacteria bacterium]|uniref:Uncharacterized protein n=1 Tax=Candidatus Sungiibacteriota bacterium TaxID=2750080 RepID=A0A9D6LT01_9BACT|nr:hypothetical protein [Candidatus Sungbacteria bacterium]